MLLNYIRQYWAKTHTCVKETSPANIAFTQYSEQPLLASGWHRGGSDLSRIGLKITAPKICWFNLLWNSDLHLYKTDKYPSNLPAIVAFLKIRRCLLTFWIYNKSFWVTKVTSAKFFGQTESRLAVQEFFWSLCLRNTCFYPASLCGCIRCMNECCMNANVTVHSVGK